ncbi:MAG TPA: caspase family protein [Devosia sp.]|nr:caspase family protein [Devosia sp.]
MRNILPLLVALSALLALPGPPALGSDLRGVALVIGESDYVGLRDLGNPERDARAMGELLDGLGFDVSRVLDGDRAKLKARIDRFVEDAADADVALIYYSGHGIEAGGGDYIVPVDADISTPERAGESLVSVADLLDRLGRVVPVSIVLLDACRTNAFPDGTMVALPGSSHAVAVAPTGLGALRGPTPAAAAPARPDELGTVIGFSASPGQAALDGPAGGNSPYAAALIKHLGAGGYSLNDLMTLVTEEVYLKTGARQLPWTNSSLRRVLSLGGAGEASDPDEAAITRGRRQLLMTIAALPEGERRQVEAAAQQGGVPMDALYGLLAALGSEVPNEPGALNKLLDAQTARLKQIMAEQTALGSADPEIVRLSGLAQQALAEGALEANVSFWEAAKARYAEVSKQLDVTEAELRARRLEGGNVLAKTGDAYLLKGDYAQAARNFGLAYEEVRRWDDEKALDYKWAEAGALESEGDFGGDKEALIASVAAYKEALALAPRESRPRDWAGIKSDLSIPLQLLAQRTGDRALLAQAADAVKATLEVTTYESDPKAWALAQNNLGTILNDIGYNGADVSVLEQAVDAFRAALKVRTRQERPKEWAMTETNLGVALDRLARLTGKDASYEDAIAAFRAALEIETRDADPFGWADNQVNMGISMQALGVRHNDMGLIAQAADAFGKALEVRTRDRVPLDWAASQLALGWTKLMIAEATSDDAALAEAEAAYRAALSEYRPDRGASTWANAESGLGSALLDRAAKTHDTAALTEAVAAFEAATTVWTQADYPSNWANTQGNLARTLVALGRLDEAVSAYKASQQVYTQADHPREWAIAEVNIGWLVAASGLDRRDRLAVLSGKLSIETSMQVLDRLGLPHNPAFYEDRLKMIDEGLANLP